MKDGVIVLEQKHSPNTWFRKPNKTPELKCPLLTGQQWSNCYWRRKLRPHLGEMICLYCYSISI